MDGLPMKVTGCIIGSLHWNDHSIDCHSIRLAFLFWTIIECMFLQAIL